MSPRSSGSSQAESAGTDSQEPLDRYRKKRNFARTPEPAPSEQAGAGNGFSFVVQKHAARRLHYDFRLELNGTLKSWAVTKGPSLDPAVKRLAVHVEDHPLEYGGFEGVIPKGQYGGGTVMLWDRGRWEPVEDPEKGYVNGKLAFRLYGKRMKGVWKLVRMGGRSGEGGKNWLLLKADDASAKPGDGDRLVDADLRSVASKRTMAQIAKAADRVWNSKQDAAPAARPAPPPQWPVDPQTLGVDAVEPPSFVPPVLATLVDRPPQGSDWLHEIKFDGYRMQCLVQDGKARMLSRNGLDWTDRFSQLAEAAARLPVRDAILDGEVVALLPSGVSSFGLLQDAIKSGSSGTLIYYLFDLLRVDGRDLRPVATEQRKELLAALLATSTEGPIRYSDHHVASGPSFFDSACRMALEGVISKRREAPYRAGRSRDWLKSKCIERDEFVIGGFTKPTTKSRGIGALLLGVYRKGSLLYVGRVGTGFSDRASRELRDQLDGMIAGQSPFVEVPADLRRGVTWVSPSLVCEVEYRSWTPDGRLRHASFQGLREDKPADQVDLEGRTIAGKGRPAGHAEPSILDEVRLSHPDRVLYPQQGLTKRGLAEYYVEVADWILPHLAGRPLSLVRCPGGADKECFYQKHIGAARAPGLRQVMIEESKGPEAYTVVDDVRGLLDLVQMNVLEIHPWGSRADDVERPDRIIFDLDPDDAVPWSRVVEAAKEMRRRLADQGLVSFLKTTGGKGLHVVVPILPDQEWPAVNAFCAAFAKAAVNDAPERYTANLAKAARHGKIFIDYLRNGRGATAIAAYSPRARPNAAVATPLDWDELSADLTSGHFTVETLPRRLDALASDPWGSIAEVRQSIRDKLSAK